jgi:hypothetical protein
MLAGPVVVLVVAAGIVMFDPDMMLGDDNWDGAGVTPTPSLADAPYSGH